MRYQWHEVEWWGRGLKARKVIAQAEASRRAEAWVNAIKWFSGLSGRHRVNAYRRAGPAPLQLVRFNDKTNAVKLANLSPFKFQS